MRGSIPAAQHLMMTNPEREKGKQRKVNYFKNNRSKFMRTKRQEILTK